MTSVPIPIPLSEEEYYYKLDNMLLTSTQHLRQFFKSRYKSQTGNDWVDDIPRIREYFEGPGKLIMKKAQHSQQSKLIAFVKDWDMSLLWIAIKYSGNGENLIETQNAAVDNLKNMRNHLAHHPTKKISHAEFQEKVEMFRTSLQDLGIEAQQVEKDIDRAGVTSSLKAFESVKTLFQKADDFLKAGEPEKALDCYSEAILTPSLLPENRGLAYEKRAEHYLGLVKDPIKNKDLCTLAVMDISKALELNDSSWTAHYLAAQCYRHQNDLFQAIPHYQRALAISPVQKHVKSDLDSCKVLAGQHQRHEYLNKANLPISLTEHLAELEKETGQKYSEDEYLRKFEKEDSHVPRNYHVFQGHKHFNGWGVPQSHTEALKHYTAAARLKNPEGMHHFAMCYNYGYGIKQDVNEALRLYKEAAEMDHKTPGNATLLRFNYGVATSQHAVGLFYHDGIGVDVDYGEAAKWYHLAMENGEGGAATDLGLLYIHGLGVPRDFKMAEECWKQAVNLRDINAPACLVTYYLQEMEPDKAIEMFEIGRDMGNPSLLNMPDSEFARNVWFVKENRDEMEESVKTLEQREKWEAKGLTFKQRLGRKIHFEDPTLLTLQSILNTALSQGPSSNDHDPVKPFTWEMIKVLQKKAVQGSETAQRIVDTIKSASQLIVLLKKAPVNSEKWPIKVLNATYNCVGLEWHILVPFLKESPASWQKLKTFLSQMFEIQCSKTSEDDMKIRLCYVAINLSGSVTSEDMYAVEVLKEGVRRYPENVHYHVLLSGLSTAKNQFPDALKYSEEGLKLSPDNPDLLHFRAFSLHRTASSLPTAQVISALQQFLSKAPYDHRKVPDALYKISTMYVTEIDRTGTSVKLPSVEDFFKRGQDAEQSQLPCYPAYGDADLKRLVPKFIAGVRNGLQELDQPVSLPPVKDDKITMFDKKPYLKSPVRKALIREHRQKLKEWWELQPKGFFCGLSISPKLEQPKCRDISALRPITLHEMNPTKDHIFYNRVIQLTIIDDPVNFPHSVHLVCEDENGDVVRMFAYVKGSSEDFECGCRLAIINPYMRIAAVDHVNALRNDEPKCIIYLEKIFDMCRFCGEENAVWRCSKCQRPYCSRKCLELDWKEHRHKLICSLHLNIGPLTE